MIISLRNSCVIAPVPQRRGTETRLYGGEGGIRTLDGLLTHTPLAGERLQPLGHLSGILRSTFCRRDYTEKVYLENNRKLTTSLEAIIALRVFRLLLRL